MTTHLLGRAIIRDGDRILLVRARGQSHTFLPGGHVEEGEGLEACVRRELREELGIESRVNHYVGAVEHRWHRDDVPQYEINHCFAVEAPGLTTETAPEAQEEYLTFHWASVGALDEFALQPPPLREYLGRSSSTPWWGSTLDPVART